MGDLKITINEGNKRLEEAYTILLEKVNAISNQFQLNYFELYGIIEAVKSDLFNQVNEEE